jgi:hypothetical protein
MLKYVWQVSFVQSVSEHGAGTGVGKLRKDEQSTFSLSSFLEHEKIISIKKQIEKIFFILWSIMRE